MRLPAWPPWHRLSSRLSARWAFGRDLIGVAAIAALCTVLSLEAARRLGGVTVLWPLDGVLLAVLLRVSTVRGPAYLLIGCATSFAVGLVLGHPLSVCVRLVGVTIGEVGLAWALLRSNGTEECDLSHPRQARRFALVAVLVAPAAAGTLDLAWAGLGFGTISLQTLLACCLSHLLGMLIVAPIALAVRRRRPVGSAVGPTSLSRGAAFACLFCIVWLVFLQSRYPLLFLIFPPLVFIVFRCGLVGGLLGVLMTMLLSLGMTLAGFGPTSLIVDATIVDRVLILQLFAAAAGGLVLTMSAVLAERDRAIADLTASKEELSRLAAIDGLTGLGNRRQFDKTLATECKRAMRAGLPLSLLLIDVDRFKAYNDTYGHQKGDACLRAIADVLGSYARRDGDLAARYGGEEFVLLLPDTPEGGALVVAEQVCSAVAARAYPHEGNAACGRIVTVSIGVATAVPGELDYRSEALIQAADDMLYEAKRTGRNRVLSVAQRPADPVAPAWPREAQRLLAVDDLRTAARERPSAALDAIAKRAATLLDAPIGLVSLVGRDDQVFVGRHGLGLGGTPREESFCAHTMTGSDVLVVPDATKDKRFADNRLVTGHLNVRFYAGAPLVTSEGGHPLGALCVLDRAPSLTESENCESECREAGLFASGWAAV